MNIIFRVLFTFLLVFKNSAVSDDVSYYRLPTDIAPTHYDIDLTTNLTLKDPKEDSFIFHGTVKIKFKVLNAVSNIVLHKHRELSILSHSLQMKDSNFTSSAQMFDSISEKWNLHFNTTLIQSENYVLTISYSGLINGDMKGFYRSYYYENGNKMWLATTQFQSTSARRAFPCKKCFIYFIGWIIDFHYFFRF